MLSTQPKRLQRNRNPNATAVRATESGDFYHVSFPYSEELVNRMREVRRAVGGSWNREARRWEIPATPEAREKLIEAGFLSPDAPETAAVQPRRGMTVTPRNRPAQEAKKPEPVEPVEHDPEPVEPVEHEPEPIIEAKGDHCPSDEPDDDNDPDDDDFDIDEEEPDPDPRDISAKSPKEDSVRVIDGKYRISIAYDEERIEQIRRMPERRWDYEGGFWEAPRNAASTAILAKIGLVDGDPEPDFSRLKGPALYPFQMDGVKRLCERRLSALLADPVGAGKSVQAICAVQALGATPCLVICSKKRVRRWIEDIRRFARATVAHLDRDEIRITSSRGARLISARLYPPACRMDKLAWYAWNVDRGVNGRAKIIYEREKRYEALPEAEFYVCDFESLRKYGRALSSIRTVIVDDCHRLGMKPRPIQIAEPSGQDDAPEIPSADDRFLKWERYAWLILTKAYYAMFISSYPIERKPMRFYGVLNRIMPEKIGSVMKFGQKYCVCEESDFSGSGYVFGAAVNPGELAEFVGDGVIRRSIEEIEGQAPDLLPKDEKKNQKPSKKEILQ